MNYMQRRIGDELPTTWYRTRLTVKGIAYQNNNLQCGLLIPLPHLAFVIALSVLVSMDEPLDNGV